MNGEYGGWIPACAGMTVGAGEFETRPYRQETEWRLWKLDSCLRGNDSWGGEVFSPHLYSLPYHGREVNEWRVW